MDYDPESSNQNGRPVRNLLIIGLVVAGAAVFLLRAYRLSDPSPGSASYATAQESSAQAGSDTSLPEASVSVESASVSLEEEERSDESLEAMIPGTTTDPFEVSVPEEVKEALDPRTPEMIVASWKLEDHDAFCQKQLSRSRSEDEFWETCPKREVALLTPNPYSRPTDGIDTVTTLVIHYVGNTGSSAMDNRNYFESLKETKERHASSHFVVGLEGEIVQCIPLSEIGYASNDRNDDTIAIECCHPGEDGKFNEKTYHSVIELSAFLCRSFHIDPQELLRHYDVSGKDCPLYYVEHPDEWEKLKNDVSARLFELLDEE